MELSKQIKKYRAEANLSQEELADKVFVSRSTFAAVIPGPAKHLLADLTAL